MKNQMPHNDRNTAPTKTSKKLTDSCLQNMSKSQIFGQKIHKKSVSIEKYTKPVSKNDMRISIYIDATGFFVQYGTLNSGLKCECKVVQELPKSNLFLNFVKQHKINKVPIQISLSQSNISLVKSGVQHIFPLIEDSKKRFLKIVLLQNWQIRQFYAYNKKIKIQNFSHKQMNDYDEIYPLTKISEADNLRKVKLIKSQSKINILWNNEPKDNQCKQTDNILTFRKSFQGIEQKTPLLKSMILKKSFNQNDQTRDSQQQDTIEERMFQSLGIKNEKQSRINIKLWAQH